MHKIAKMFKIAQPALQTFLKMALAHSSTPEGLLSRVIILSYVDSGYMDMAENRHVTFRKLGIDNYLFVTPNSETVKELDKRGMRGVALWEDDKNTTEAIDFGTKNWGNKVMRKLPMGEFEKFIPYFEDCRKLFTLGNNSFVDTCFV